MAGRKPNLSADKALHRSNAEIQERGEQLPIYQSQIFKAPKTLTSEEKKVWKWLVNIFRETVNCRASDADVHLMELYCRAKVATDEADAALKDDPRAYIPYNIGEGSELKVLLKANPNIKKRNDNASLCIRLFDQLGLSPTARARAGLAAANAKKKDDPFRRLMDRKDE